ncbi:hypothetical protein L195_g043146, partial [Trifolium pratense]
VDTPDEWEWPPDLEKSTQHKLPMKYNLFVRGCFQNDSILCSAGCNI